MRWRRPVKLCGLCLMEWEHEDCQEITLWVPWWAANAVHRAYLEARR